MQNKTSNKCKFYHNKSNTLYNNTNNIMCNSSAVEEAGMNMVLEKWGVLSIWIRCSSNRNTQAGSCFHVSHKILCYNLQKKVNLIYVSISKSCKDINSCKISQTTVKPCRNFLSKVLIYFILVSLVILGLEI